MLVIDGDSVSADDGFGVIGIGVGDWVSIGAGDGVGVGDSDGVGVGDGDGVGDGVTNANSGCILMAPIMAVMVPIFKAMIFNGHLLWGAMLSSW